MSLRPIPGPRLAATLAASAAIAVAALIAGVELAMVSRVTALGVLLLAAIAVFDYVVSRRAWRAAAATMDRVLPAAFALGVPRDIDVRFTVQGGRTWRCRWFDHADPSLLTAGMPHTLDLAGGTITSARYQARPTRRGEVEFAPADLVLRSRLQCWELRARVGERETRRVYPDFAQVARFAWLAGDRRLAEIGIRTFQQRGEGTDFKQLAEYRTGDPIRHVDWKATMRVGKPIVRQFQHERDQCVMLLVDCGRRMRSDDREGDIGTAHFDQVLNAVMLLTHVALNQGDAVGAVTFGAPPGDERWFAPRKGAHVLNALMSELYDVQPTPTHSDYLQAARDFLRRQRKRALVILITNFRDEDVSELDQALRLLRSRHLVLTASLRESVVRELISQPLLSSEAVVAVAGAHLYEQSRRDAFNRIAAKDALMVDAEPQRLGVELVNRYRAVKRAGMI
jgi:uncharacterized protein (DUF58 family)